MFENKEMQKEDYGFKYSNKENKNSYLSHRIIDSFPQIYKYQNEKL